MAQYTINLNERTVFGRNILAMLQAIPQIGITKVESKRCYYNPEFVAKMERAKKSKGRIIKTEDLWK